MRILMLLQDFFPPDIRVEKEARALVKAGHEVCLLALGKRGQSQVEKVDGIKVIRLFHWSGPATKLASFFFFGLTMVDPFFYVALKRLLRESRYDAIHVHDLPLVQTALKAASRLGIPVIADLHENYPEALRAWRRVRKGPLSRAYSALTPIERWKKVKKKSLELVSRIITVSEESKRYYIEAYGIPEEKITVVSNFVDLKKIRSFPIKEEIKTRYERKFVLSYIGGFGPHRGIELAIRSMPMIIEEIPNSLLLLVGSGEREYVESLKSLVEKMGIEDHVEFTGWVDFHLVPSFILVSDVCLALHERAIHTETTVPHKIFQYMAFGKPVIVTDIPTLRRIVQECGAGLVVEGVPERVAEALIILRENPELAKKMGERGKKCVEEKYNWEAKSKRLLKLYEDLSSPT